MREAIKGFVFGVLATAIPEDSFLTVSLQDKVSESSPGPSPSGHFSGLHSQRILDLCLHG